MVAKMFYKLWAFSLIIFDFLKVHFSSPPLTASTALFLLIDQPLSKILQFVLLYDPDQ